MTPTEIADLNLWLHINVFDGNKFVGLKKRGLWYRPDAKGYTDNPDAAGRYTLEEAKRHEYKGGGAWDEPVTIHEFPVKDYTTDPAASDALDDLILKKLDDEGYEVWCRDGVFMVRVNPQDEWTRHADKKICRMLFAKKLFSHE